MKIVRTKDNGYGWRTKFKLLESDNILEITKEKKDKDTGKWKNSSGDVKQYIWLDSDGIKELKEFVKKYL